MTTNRLEAFSDGVIAILITIMVLELKVPHRVDLAALRPLVPILLSYLLSFIYLGIYWNNHHHMFQVSDHVSGGVLWANLHLLFWLSLVPFVTGWANENHFEPVPVAAYGVVLLMAAVAYTILVRLMLSVEGRDSVLADAIGKDRKGWVSLVCYVVAIPLALAWPIAAVALYVLVAIIWLIPDPRIERALDRHAKESAPHPPTEIA